MHFRTDTSIEPPKTYRIMLIAAVMLVCMVVVFRFELLNRFTVLQGDRFDGVIVSVILEHWFHVLTRGDSWLEANYFFPYTRTIAQSDGYFLIGLAYVPFRLIGLDPFLATELASMIIKATGFVGMYLLCRRIARLPFYWALFAAVLFTLNNGTTIHGWRIQLATVALAPVMALCLAEMGIAFTQGHAAQFRRWGMSTGILFGAWCLTCFYMAWFFVLFFTVFFVVLLTMGGRTGLSLLRRRLVEQYLSVLVVCTVALIAVTPFLFAFLPKSREVGVRTYAVLQEFLVSPSRVLQVGQNNLLQGPLYNRLLKFLSLNANPAGEYANTGFTIVLFALFVAGCVYLLKRWYRKSGVDPILPAIVVTTLLTWPLILNVHGHSAWLYVYEWFPGAKALRVVATYQIFLAMPVVLIAVNFLAKKKLPVPLLAPLIALLIASEINVPYVALNRKDELARVALSEPIPAACKVFYVSGWSPDASLGELGEVYTHNVSAMFIAQEIGIPTVNGIASFNPPDWIFNYPNRPDYDQRVRDYAVHHQVTGLCRLELNTKQWSTVSLPK